MADDPRNPAAAADQGRRDGDPGVELQDARARLDVLQGAARVFAHDFKNPLSALLLGVQRLARFARPDHQAQARAMSARLEATIQTMNRLVEGLADLARHLAGELQLDTARQPAAEILARAVDPLRAGAAERQQGLTLELRTDLPEVEWDGERVIKALQHVLGMALQATPEGGTVRCSAELGSGLVLVTVVGTAPQTAPAAAAPLRTASEGAPPRRARELALAVARALAEAHGGSLETEGAREGSPEFRLALPISAGAPR